MNHDHAYLRYQVIDQCLNATRKEWTKKGLLEQLSNNDFPISASTLEKDINKMRSGSLPFGKAPITWCPKRKIYFYEKEFAINIPVNAEELRSLEMAVRTLNQFKDIAYFSQFAGAVDKVIRFVRQIKASQNQSAMPAILFEKVPYLKGYEHLDAILNAISSQQCLWITYHPFEREPYKTELHPYFVKEFHNRWYVVGLTDYDTELRTFALDRIDELTLITSNYVPNTTIDPEAYFKDCIGINFMNRKIEKVRLTFTPYQGNYVKTQYLHRSQIVTKPGPDEVIIELDIIVNHELKMLILSFGDQVRVLEPISLAKDIAKISRRVARAYRASPQLS